jgi:hypothetical protein
LNEKQLKIFIRQAFSLDNIADTALDRTDGTFKQIMAMVREKVLKLPEASLLRDQEWTKMLGEISTILQSGNNVFAQFLIEELRSGYPEMEKNAKDMISQISTGKIFPGAAGEIEGMPSVAGLQTVELQDSVKDAIRNTKVNNTRLIDLFGLQDVDQLKPAIFRQTMTPWIKSNLKIIDRTVRAGILQGADTQAIADRIADVMIVGVKKRGVLDPATKLLFEGKDAYRQLKAQAKAVARTAVQDMNRQVNEQVWNDNQFSSDLRWEWVAAFDSRTCQVCAPLDNILRKDRKSFPNWPVHVNCRCQVVLVDPEDTDARAGIDISPEEDGFEKKGGRKYKSKINVKGDKFYRKAFDVKGENPSYADFLAQADRVTQGTFFGGDNAGSIRAERFRSLIKQGYKPREALNKLITNAPRPKSNLKELVSKAEKISKIKFKSIEELVPKRGLSDFDFGVQEGGKIFDQWDKELGLTNSFNVYQSIQKKQNKIFDQLMERYLAVPQGPKKAAAKAAFLKSTSYSQRAFDKYKNKFSKIREKMLQTNLSDEEVNKLVDGVWFSEHKIIKNRENYKKGTAEFIRMFNGKGFRKAVEGSATDPRNSPTIGIIQASNKRAGNGLRGTLTVPEEFDKGTLFHEIMHSVEAQRPWMGNGARKWAAKKAFSKSYLSNPPIDPIDNPKAFKKLTNMLDFHFKGTALEKPLISMNGLTGRTGFDSWEKGWADKYLTEYMGKYYDMKSMGFPDLVATEVYTVAVERLAENNPTQISSLYTKHPDIFKFLIWLSQQP